MACLASAAYLGTSSSVARADGSADARPRSADDAFAPYRERFKQGMDRYKSGNMGEAIQYWEPIYREVGPEKGYRLSFDLARAYDSVGESTRAAERYESFLNALGARRAAGENLEPLVLREEDEAKRRLEELQTAKGRIRISPGPRPLLAQVDLAEPRLGSYVTYVAPGSHVVTFGPGAETAEKHTVEVKAGEVVEIAPNPEPEAPAPPTPPPTPPPKGEPPPAMHQPIETTHPFPALVVYLTGGAAAVSTIVPIVTYGNAWSIKHSYQSAPNTQTSIDYYGARTTAYASLAIPIGLGAAATALAIWYLAGTKTAEVSTVSAGLAPTKGGAAGTLSVRF